MWQRGPESRTVRDSAKGSITPKLDSCSERTAAGGREMPAAKSVFLWTWADHVFFAYTYPERKDNLMSQGHLLMLNGYMGPRILNCLPEVPARERCCSPEKEILPDTGCACTMHPKGEALCFSWGAAGGGRNQSYRAEEGLA
jgi:hypothetical protein